MEYDPSEIKPNTLLLNTGMDYFDDMSLEKSIKVIGGAGDID